MAFGIEDIADEVAAVLISAEIAADVDFSPTVELPESEKLRVLVCPGGLDGEVENRLADQEDHVIHVGVIVRVGKDCTGDNIREQLAFVRSIRDLFKRRLLETTRVTLAAFANNPIYRPEKLRDEGLFVSVLKLTFRGFR